METFKKRMIKKYLTRPIWELMAWLMVIQCGSHGFEGKPISKSVILIIGLVGFVKTFYLNRSRQ